MRSQIELLGATALIFLLCGCDAAWTTKDSWYREPSRELSSQLSPVDPAQFAPVLSANEKAAEQLLADRPFCAITVEQEKALLGRELPLPKGHQVFLLRGVCLNERTGGGFGVSAKDGYVLVYHWCMGHWPVPMKRRAVVVILAEPPREVFVSCSMVS